jgi:hypothetical protein
MYGEAIVQKLASKPINIKRFHFCEYFHTGEIQSLQA